MKDLAKQSNKMSSTQLLKMLHFESKSSIHKAIRIMFAQKIDDSILESSIDSRGYVEEYYLPELESKMFVAKHDINYLEQITQFWIEKGKTSKELNESLIKEVTKLRSDIVYYKMMYENSLELLEAKVEPLIALNNRAKKDAREELLKEIRKQEEIEKMKSTKYRKEKSIIEWFDKFWIKANIGHFKEIYQDIKYKAIPSKIAYKMFKENNKGIINTLFTRVIKRNFDIVHKNVKFGHKVKKCFMLK